MYRFKIKHTPGKHHVGLDATSRYPSASHLCALLLPDPPHHTPNHATDIVQCVTSSLAKSYSADRHFQAITWEWIRATASQDTEGQELLKAISNGFPNTKETLPEVICCFWPMRDELYSIDGVILKDEKILIPLPLRAETLECLHAAHQGVNGMLANTRQRLFWPGMEANLLQT